MSHADLREGIRFRNHRRVPTCQKGPSKRVCPLIATGDKEGSVPLIPSALLAEDEGEDESTSRERGAENHRIAKTGSLGRAFRNPTRNRSARARLGNPAI